MGIRKEQAIFLGAVAILGWNGRGFFQDGGGSVRGSRGGERAEFVSHAAPHTALALHDGDRTRDLGRDLFTPPSDTQPLPPLPLELPPVERLEALRPPAAWGPAAKYMSEHLRVAVEVELVPDLFVGDLAPELEIDYVDGADRPGPGPPGQDQAEDLTAEERAQRIAGWKKLYDWIFIADLKFGQIRNNDRYGLASRDEEVLFVQVNPETGLDVFPGQKPIPYDRERVAEFGFADTPSNNIEIELEEFGDELRPAAFERALIFGEKCIELRNEAPRALEIAEEMFRRANEVNSDDVRPHLGLARCYEFGFRFEDARAKYEELLAGEHKNNPVVYARLGDLLARFRMFDWAEDRFREALRLSRTNWEVRWRYGRFLLERGRGEEAVEHLAEAVKREPQSPETRSVRVGIRSDFGWALVNVGRMADALEAFTRAIGADPLDQRGPAGAYSAALFLDTAEAQEFRATVEAVLAEDIPSATFEALLAIGLQAIEHEQWQAAKRNLELAAESDPFRAYLPWRSLSWLAEITGYPEEALVFIEKAYENNPTDAWTLFQRARLYAAQDDIEGALENFKSALDQELDFTDALINMAWLEQQRGNHADAERFYERALGIDPGRSIALSLRGFNHFELGQDAAAEENFRKALSTRGDLSSAKSGLAWWYYRVGESEESRVQFADLIDERRNLPEDDPAKLYAQAQIERIQDHEDKEVWSDHFERRAGQLIRNGWSTEDGYGPTVRLIDGTVMIEGLIDEFGRTRAFQELPGEKFLSFEADVTIHPGSRDVRAGIFLSRERMERGVDVMQAGASISRNKDGTVQSRFVRQGERDAPYTDIFDDTEWRIGEPMRVKIERIGDANDTAINLYLDGVPVVEGESMTRLGRTTQSLRFGLFVEGDTSRNAKVSIDNVEVIRRSN